MFLFINILFLTTPYFTNIIIIILLFISITAIATVTNIGHMVNIVYVASDKTKYGHQHLAILN